jgi:hypothetical protein
MRVGVLLNLALVVAVATVAICVGYIWLVPEPVKSNYIILVGGLVFAAASTTSIAYRAVTAAPLVRAVAGIAVGALAAGLVFLASLAVILNVRGA